MTAAERLLATAKAELGYTGKKSNAQLDDPKANTPGLFNKFARDLDALGDFYNGRKNGYDWCDVFVDWCFYKTFGRALAQKLLCQPDKSCGAGTKYSMDYYKAKGRWFTSPQPGDQIFFGTATVTSHTGIVTGVSGGYLTTVEGNCGSPSAVRQCKYPVGYASIKGYGRPDWSLVKEDKPAETGNPVTAESAANCDKTRAGTYIVTADPSLNIRTGAGTGKPLLGTLPRGTEAVCYGYYNTAAGVPWLLVAANGITGYVHSGYLEKKAVPAVGSNNDNIREDDAMSEEQVRKIVREEWDRLEAERAAKPASDWAKTELAAAKAAGITDGQRPRSFVTREEAVAMVLRGRG